MKKSSLLLALGLVFFLGACSTMEEDFLNKVQGKTAYDHATSILPANSYGTFSSNGKKLINNVETLNYVKMIDDTTASYTVSIPAEGSDPASTRTYSIATSDGNTGTMTMTTYIVGDEDSTDNENLKKPQPIWLKVK